MNTLKTALILFFAFTVTACSGTRSVTTPLTDREMVVDGSLSGWSLDESVIERTDIANYYATHDNNFLYLFIDVQSPGHNNAMRQSGFIIYISDNEDNRKQTGIAFPSGSFNLLRENPGAYNSFVNDPEWGQNPRNRELLQNLEEDIFDRIMVVEQSSSGTDRGFINRDQLQIDGIQIAAEEGRRMMSIELRVPLNQSSIYNIHGDRIWVGFEIDPPNFRRQDNSNQMQQQQRYGGQRRASQSADNRRSNIRQRMGQFERWYRLDLGQ